MNFSNANGVITVPIVLSGRYSVSSNGRTTGSINTLSNNLVFYLVSAATPTWCRTIPECRLMEQ